MAEDFLQPFKSQGVLEIDDVGMVIRGKFMAKLGKQFMIRKEIFNRVNAAFEENGIEFARREVRVALPSMARRPMNSQLKTLPPFRLLQPKPPSNSFLKKAKRTGGDKRRTSKSVPKPSFLERAETHTIDST